MHCPECDGISYSRKTKTPEWRCRKCGHEWDMGPALNTSSSTIPVPRRPGIDNICQWEPQFVDSSLRCRRRIDSGHPNLCILHLPDPDKSYELFYRALGEKFVQDESNPQVREINLAGVVFKQMRRLVVALDLTYRRKRLIPVGKEFDEKPVTKRVTFAEATFLGDLERRPQMGGLQDCRSLVFHGMANFQHAHFETNADFMNVRFHAGVNFDDARFEGSARFGFGDRNSVLPSWPHFAPPPTIDKPKPAVFGGNTSFRRTRFEGSATFYGCQFNGVDFSEVRFSEGADFMGTEFNAKAIFKQVNFEKGARFGQGDVEFFGVNGLFVGDADFSGARFRGVAKFWGDIFHEGTNRVGSTAWQFLTNGRWRWPDYRPGPFGGNANFANARFDQLAEFPGAHFANRANFSNVKFPETEEFPGADFRRVQFSGDAVFIGARFGVEYHFPGARFGGAAIFKGALFPKQKSDAFSPPFDDVQFKNKPDFGNYRLEGGYPLSGTPRNTRNQ